MSGTGVIPCIIATIVATIAITSGSNDRVSGGYIYYVNGVRIGSALNDGMSNLCSCPHSFWRVIWGIISFIIKKKRVGK